MTRITGNNAATAVLCAFLAAIIMFLTRGYWFTYVDNAVSGIRADWANSGIFYRVSDYDAIHCAYGNVYFSSGDEYFAECASKTLDFYYPLLAADMGVSGSFPVNIILYPSSEAMRDALGIDLTANPMGLYYLGGIHILSPRAYFSGEEHEIAGKFVKKGPVIHELAHFLMDVSIGNEKTPTWINEGVALYFENKYLNYEWRPDLSEEAGRLPDERLLSFSGDESVLYRRAYDVIAAYVGNNGEKALIALLKTPSKTD